MSELEREFRDVGIVGKGAEFRGAPFWSWNDKLDQQELRRQIRAMHKGGLGGHFMHSRVGLETPYMGKEWMECIAACVDESKKLSMYAWLYDEDKWPSGFAGGLVSGRGGEYNQQCLCCREQHINWYECEFIPRDRSLRCYLGVKQGRTIRNLVDVTGTALNLSEHRGKSAFEFYVERGGYVDLLNPKVVDAFIQTTYEPYFERFGEEFGWNGAIPGIFTDEPNYSQLPWTGEMPRTFKQRRGYDILDHLPCIFYEVDMNGRDWRKVRHDYYRTATEMFVEVFTKRIYDWCQVRNLALTGHFLAEDNLASQIHVIGAAMPHYEFMQIPGIDHLSRWLGSVMLVKQVSSVAHQFGGRRVLSEMFGCSGWNMSFEDQRWIAEWQFALGVDLVCQHLTLYSLRGCRKRDYPPSFNDHQPWWDYFHLVNDRFARITYMLTRGKHVADILVLHPISSAWCLFHPQYTQLVMELSNQFEQLSNWMLELHCDYDYGDELIMRRHAGVEGGKLRVGACAYSVVMIPPSLSMFTETFERLQEFAAQGGKIIAIEPLPTMIEGEPSDDLQKFLKRNAKVVRNDKRAIERALDEMLLRSISIRDGNGEAPTILYQERDIGERRAFFIVNKSKEAGANVEVRIRGKGQLQAWDVDTGKIEQLPCKVESDEVVTQLELAPVESRMLVLDSRKQPTLGEPQREETVAVVEASPRWKLERLNLNALTLDYCDYRIDDGDWKEHQPVIWLYRELMNRGEPCKLVVRYRFNVEQLPKEDAPLWLAIETSRLQRIYLNGKRIPSEDEGFWLDQAFRKLDIRGKLHLGENVIECRWNYEPPMEVESCYIVGEFGVHITEEGRNFVITSPPPEEVEGDDLLQQGLPFYCGKVAFTQTAELPTSSELEARHVRLEVDALNAIVADVSINGKPAGVLAWRPLRLDVTKLVRGGKNELRFVLINSPRNLLGPHHHRAGELFSVGPGSFEGGGWGGGRTDWVNAYHFVPFGIAGARFKFAK